MNLWETCEQWSQGLCWYIPLFPRPLTFLHSSSWESPQALLFWTASHTVPLSGVRADLCLGPKLWIFIHALSLVLTLVLVHISCLMFYFLVCALSYLFLCLFCTHSFVFNLSMTSWIEECLSRHLSFPHIPVWPFWSFCFLLAAGIPSPLI